MSKQEKALTKDRLIGMQVIDSEGNGAGTIKDIAFTVGKVGMTLIVETEKGQDKEVPWEQIQAAGDYVLLKPSTAQTFGPQAVASTSAGPNAATHLSYMRRTFDLHSTIPEMVLLQGQKIRVKNAGQKSSALNLFFYPASILPEETS